MGGAEDGLGNPVTPAAASTLSGVEDFVGGFLAYQPRATNILAAADADPGHCLANAYAGMLWMFLEAPEAPAKAEPYLRRALAAAGSATRREAMAAAVLQAWAADDTVRAQALAEAVVAEFPRDLAMLKLSQYFSFNRGDAEAMLRVALRAAPHAMDLPWLHGMTAFGYEQSSRLREAEASARRALDLEPAEPWAQHALAHVMITEGRIDEGARFMEAASTGWSGLNSFMSTHNWWHLALFYLRQDRPADALRLYDRHVWGVSPDYSQDQVGAVSLLARLDLAGADVAGRWPDLAAWLKAREGDTVQPFLSLQYLYGLARAGRPEASGLMRAIEARAAAASAHDRAWPEVALPAARGLLAYAEGDYRRAAEGLGGALARLSEIGGSHAQRDLFHLLHRDAQARAGDKSRN